MPTNDEKSRVAASLRNIADVSRLTGHYCTDSDAARFLCEVMGFRCSRCDSPWKGIEALADLIDPDIIPDNRDRTERSLSETTEGPTSCDKAQTCDRDALLALADELEKWSLMCDHCDRQVSPLDVTKYARRIREAVGA